MGIQMAKLTKLANELYNLPLNRFTMNDYAVGDPRKPDKVCGIGLSTQIFPRSGLKLIKDETGRTGRHNDKNGLAIKYKTKTVEVEGDAVSNYFFGLTDKQANYLFFLDSYPVGRRGPRSMARRIEKFVRSGGKLPSTT